MENPTRKLCDAMQLVVLYFLLLLLDVLVFVFLSSISIASYYIDFTRIVIAS